MPLSIVYHAEVVDIDEHQGVRVSPVRIGGHRGEFLGKSLPIPEADGTTILGGLAQKFFGAAKAQPRQRQAGAR